MVVVLGVMAGIAGDITGESSSGGGDDYSLAIPPTPKTAGFAKTRPTAGPDLALKAVPSAATEASAPAPEPTPTAEPLPTMVVREGDTLNSLAEWFGVSAWDIANVNGMSVEDYLQIGQVLAIPVASSEFVHPPEVYVAAVEEPEPEPEPAPPPAAPTIAPVPAAVPAPPPYTPPSGDAVIAAICSLPWPCEQMVRIARCESGLNPRAINPAGYYGLFQIDTMIAAWDDPYTNASYAYHYKYLPAAQRGDPLSPWPACRYAYSPSDPGGVSPVAINATRN